MSPEAMDAFGAMIRHGLEIQRKHREEAENLRRREEWASRLRAMFGHMSRDEVRALWANIDDDTSFCGEYDCADIHGYLNLIGDGRYCAV